MRTRARFVYWGDVTHMVLFFFNSQALQFFSYTLNSWEWPGDEATLCYSLEYTSPHITECVMSYALPVTDWVPDSQYAYSLRQVV